MHPQDALTEGELVVLARHPSASNVVVAAQVRRPTLPPVTVAYKPVTGERPLWDFPDGSLATREVAAQRVDELAGFDLIPTTVLREGPLGPGSVQRWVGELTTPCPTPVVVTPAEEVPDGNLVVLVGEDERGAPVVLSHPDHPRLRSMAVLDAVLNNSDRKGGHVLIDGEQLWGIDHGVSLHVDPKLRTVLWGWAGQAIVPADLERLARLATALDEPAVENELTSLVTAAEFTALRQRTANLRDRGVHPLPSPEWPSIPWPPL